MRTLEMCPDLTAAEALRSALQQLLLDWTRLSTDACASHSPSPEVPLCNCVTDASFFHRVVGLVRCGRLRDDRSGRRPGDHQPERNLRPCRPERDHQRFRLRRIRGRSGAGAVPRRRQRRVHGQLRHPHHRDRPRRRNLRQDQRGHPVRHGNRPQELQGQGREPQADRVQPAHRIRWRRPSSSPAPTSPTPSASRSARPTWSKEPASPSSPTPRSTPSFPPVPPPAGSS